MSLIFGSLSQVGLMSRDVDKSMQYFVDAWGMGPWFVLRNIKMSMLYKGEPTELDVSIAMANCGDLQFEIVQQHNDAPSLYLDSLAHTQSLHVQHVAVWTPDVRGLESKAASLGWEAVFETRSGPGRSVFITHPSEPMVCIELSDSDPFKDQVRAAIKDTAASWDGADPIRNGLPTLPS